VDIPVDEAAATDWLSVEKPVDILWIPCGQPVGNRGHTVHGRCPVDDGPVFPRLRPPVIHRPPSAV